MAGAATAGGPGEPARAHIRLRRLVGSAGVDPPPFWSAPQPGYRLNVADEAYDLGRFAVEQKAGIDAAAAGRFEQASGHLSAALAEWRGPVLEDLRDFEFVEPSPPPWRRTSWWH